MTNEPNITLSLFYIFGGVALFLYGLKRVTKSLENIAGAGLKLIIVNLTRNRWQAALIGLAIALALQSSGAVVLLLVSFTNSGLIALKEAIPVMLGAGVGSTLTVQLLAFRIYNWAPAIILVGYIVYRLGNGRIKVAGTAILSFGLVFLGMKLISAGAGPLSGDEFFSSAIEFFRRAPFFAALLAAVLTFAFQSSAAVLGILLTFAMNGILDLDAAMPFIIGANIGSCGTGFMGAVGGRSKGMKVVACEFIARLISGIVIFVFAKYYAYLAAIPTDDPARQIANAHTLFELNTFILFIPLSSLLAKIADKIIPEPSSEKAFKPKYLDTALLTNPPLALGSAAREILHEGDIVLSMVDDIIVAFSKNDRDLLKDIVARDDKVDILHESITNYLTKLSEKELSPQEFRNELQLLNLALELEHIADVVSKDLSRHIMKRLDEKYYFSDEGFGEIISFYEKVRTLFRKSLDSIPLRDQQIAREIIVETKMIIETHRKLNRSHIERLHRGVKFSVDTSAIHLDFLSDLARIAVHVSHIAYTIQGKI